jgi:hypothetical protein
MAMVEAVRETEPQDTEIRIVQGRNSGARIVSAEMGLVGS